LSKLRTPGGTGHIAVFNTLAIGHTKHEGEQRISSFPFAVKKMRASNRQDFVFIRPPGISHGAFQLRMDNVWFCKVLLLFEIESKSDIGFERHACAFVSVMEEYNGQRRPGT
jgi:hypothetical protein